MADVKDGKGSAVMPKSPKRVSRGTLTIELFSDGAIRVDHGTLNAIELAGCVEYVNAISRAQLIEGFYKAVKEVEATA